MYFNTTMSPGKWCNKIPWHSKSPTTPGKRSLYNQSINFCLTTRQKTQKPKSQISFSLSKSGTNTTGVFGHEKCPSRKPHFDFFLRNKPNHQKSIGVFGHQKSKTLRAFFGFFFEKSHKTTKENPNARSRQFCFFSFKN